MQTFLPLPSFRESARVLDYRRLGKQRVECKQILNALRSDGAWANHPATRMWQGAERALSLYGVAICQEWRRRGYRDTLLPFFVQNYSPDTPMPPWLGDPVFHASHRSNLLRKDPIHYGQFNWTEPSDLPYVWPNGNAPHPRAAEKIDLSFAQIP